MWSIDMLVHLRTFVAIAELESFSRAAEELTIGQPLLSRRIKSLEKELGGELFDRSRRQISVTDFGRALLDPARDLLARADLLDEFVRVTHGHREFRLGLPPDCDPRALARIVTRAIEIGQAIDIVELPSAARDAALEEGALAAALTRKPHDALGFHVELGLAAARPMDDNTRRALHLESLRRPRGDTAPRRRILVTPEDDVPIFLNGFLRAVTRAGLSRSQIVTATSTQAALVTVLAADDLLVCTRPFGKRHGLAWAPFADRSIARTYQLALGKSAENNPTAESLFGQLGSPLGAAIDASPTNRRIGATETGPQALVEGWK